jgi:intracellular sulfur oxidation DsrE/DsrF family protein
MMNRRRALAALAALLAAGSVRAQPRREKQRLIFQVSDRDPENWKLALANARNVQLDLGRDNVEIELVAYGPAIRMLEMESPVSGGLAQALDDGVKLIACENTMDTLKLKRDDMYGGVEFVKTGVSYIMQRQRQGWAYIRP